MNGLATAGIIGAAVGAVSGVAAQQKAQNLDPQASNDLSAYAVNGLLGAGTTGLVAMGGYAGIQGLRNSGFKIAGKTIDEIAASIAKSGPVQTVYPGKEKLEKEISEKIASYANNGTYTKLFKDSLDNSGSAVNKDLHAVLKDRLDGDTLKSMGLDDNTIQKITSMANDITAPNAQKTLESMSKLANNDNFSGYVENVIKPQITEGLTGVTGKTVVPTIGKKNFALNIPRAYYDVPEERTKKARIAATAGIATTSYIGATVGGRYATCGTLTEDTYGRKDIVGIPFI